jgi:hypothetical protein
MQTSLQMLAAIQGQDLVWLVVEIILAGLVFWIVQWGVSQIAPPEPFAKIIKVILVLAVVLFLVNALLTLGGHPLVRF